jgi:hypothetical protein
MKGNFELEPFAWESEFTSPFATFWARGFPPANQFSLSEELRAMAKDSWISDKERERILTLRKAGVPVSEIAKQAQRSTNYIYRLLRKVNGHVPTKRKPKTTVSDPPAAGSGAAPSVEAPASGVGSGSRLLDELSEVSNDELLCSVDGVHVPACEAIPMPRSMQESELRQTPARAQVQAAPVAVAAGVGFDVACQPRSTVGNDAFCRPRNDSPSAARLGRSMVVQAVDADQAPLSKKPKTSSLPLGTPSPGQNTVVPASSSLAVDFQLPRSQTLESTALSNVAASSDGLGGLLQRIQDEIRRLESLGQADLYDTQLLQMLVKFHAELLLVHIQKMHSSVSSSKRARGEDSWGTEASRLLREKLQKEIALLNIQADREKLELERDQIRHQAATMLCRNQLLGANASPTDVDQLFPRR